MEDGRRNIEVALALLQMMDDEENMWKDEVKAIEEPDALRRKYNAENKELLTCDQPEIQPSFIRVHLAAVDSLWRGTIFGFDLSPVWCLTQSLRGC
jgi:hypothetical protein